MRIIFYGLWLATIAAGSILGTIVPPSAVYLTGFTTGSLALILLHFASQFKD